MNKTIVLMTDAQQRKTLAAARSLGSKGINVITSEETCFALARFSRYSAEGLVYPSARRHPQNFYLWLKEWLKKNKCDILFPMDDCTLDVVIENYDELKNYCHIPVPEKTSYFTAADKGLSVKAAAASGIDCPDTKMPASLDELPELADSLTFPVVLKPRRSSGSRGITVVHNKKDFIRIYTEVHKVYPLPLVQEFIPQGEKYDVCLLFDRNSELKASFVQKELRYFPPDSGPSTVQESVLWPELVEKSVALLKKIKWYGVVEVEFMVDPRDGKPKFMEINPRFWASLHTAILSGVDFPWLLMRLARGENFDPVTEYRTGIRCRWSLPGDILHFLVSPDRFHLDPPFFSTSSSGVHDDILSVRDPLPILGFTMACLRYLPDIRMWRFMFKRKGAGKASL